MLKNYLIFTIRHVKNQIVYFLINIIGLGIGLGACFLLLLFAINEFSYDTYHPKANQTYRILTIDREKNRYDGKTPYPLAEIIRLQMPDVEVVAQLYARDCTFQLTNQELSGEHHWAFADQDFFKVFRIPFVNQTDHWDDPLQIYLSEGMAEQYFPNTNPIDQTISIDENNTKVMLRIAGLFKTLPSNTHLTMDVIAPLSLAQRLYQNEEFMGFKWAAFDSWEKNSLFTYIQIKKSADMENIAAQLKLLSQSHLKNPDNVDYSLQPIHAIHLHSAHINNSGGPHGNLQQTLLLLAIALLILGVAVFNFILLSTAQSNTRLREIGMRKVLGAQKKNIIRQTLAEAILTAALSLPIALLFAETILPLFKNLVQKNLVLLSWRNWLFAACALGLTAFAGFLSGAYTAFYYARVQPHHILKTPSPFHGKSVLRRLLIAAQFVIFIGLLSSTFTIFRQFNYIQHKQLGYNNEHLITIPLNSKQTIATYPTLKTELKASPYVVNVSGASYTPPTDTFIWAKFNNADKGIEFIYVDFDYFETMGIHVQEGSVFTESKSAENNGVVLTASSIPHLELEEPLGKDLFGMGAVLGIIDNFHIRSLHRDIRPVMFKLDSKNISTAIVRLQPDKIPEALNDIKRIWREVNVDTPFSFQFVDEALDLAYRADLRFGRLMQLFTFLAVFIASLGLFGLSLFMTRQKTKEIGTRKVLGASVLEIIKMLTTDFVKWVLIANVIAWPIAYYAMHKWLQNFAYRIDISWWLFALAGALALAIALLTVSWQAIRAATANPVEALRYE